MKPLAFAQKIWSMMQWTGAKVDGVYPLSFPAQQPGMPELSFTNFIVADFFVVSPQVHRLLQYRQQASPKADYDFSSSTLLWGMDIH